MGAIYSILNHALEVTGAAASSSFRCRHLLLRRLPSIASCTPHVHLPQSTTAFCLKSPCLRLLQPASLLLLLQPRFSASSGCRHIYDQDVAIKVFSKQEYTKEVIYSFRQEVSLMKRLRHPNILLFMGALTSPQHLCIVTEFLPRGSLFRLLQRNTSKLDRRRRTHMALDIVPMLLSIGEEDSALTKATESGDTDLVYMVLFPIWQKVVTQFAQFCESGDLDEGYGCKRRSKGGIESMCSHIPTMLHEFRKGCIVELFS